MPSRPPVFRPNGWREREAWERPRLYKDRRKRGRAAMRERAEVIAEEPFCRKCLAEGKQVRTDVIDHIVPLAWGGSDSRGNKQGLCHPCHDEKSKAERIRGRWGRGG
jgi:5-methylcytosine-specific restriction protein A